MTIPLPITTEMVAAYSLCKRKAFLLMRGDGGDPPHDYVRLLDAYAATSLQAFLASLQGDGRVVRQGDGTENPGTSDVLVQVLLNSDGLEATADALIPLPQSSPKGQAGYEPHLVIGSHRIAKVDKMRLAFIGHVLGEVHRHHPQTGVIVNAGGAAQRIQLTKLTAELKAILDTLKAWRASLPPEPPPVLLNDHCPMCPFKKRCLEQAEKDDSLTLLDRMTPKVMRKYHKKGIFTITQLSYLFKPRRQRKKRTHRPTGFNLELQALRLRTGKIYLHQAPSVPLHPTELFLDMEGVPDHGTNYLIGLVVSTAGGIACHSLWADSPEEERNIVERLAEIAEKHPDSPIYHYGSYEPKALERMAKKFGLGWDSIKSRLVNVNTFIFGKVYFPTRSNTLKDLGRLLGAGWSSLDASGLQSVVWRLQWEASKDTALKEQILVYNLEDCQALRILVSELRNIGQASATRSDVDFADGPKRNTTPVGQHIHDSLEGILKSAHAEYKKNRIEIRQEQTGEKASQNGPGARKGHVTYRRIVPAKANKVIRVKRRIKCPRHKGKALVPTDKTVEHTIIDLAFTRNGCRKIITKYVGTICYCPHCCLHYPPPAIGRAKNRLYGHCFRAWAVYQRISLRMPHKAILQVIYDLFREQVSDGSLVFFISGMAKYYASTEKMLLKKILASPFVHADETKINIRGTDHYVWVLTDGIHTIFRLTETREATLIQKMLQGYTGVLITDFYGGYDACECRQQKCLVHLIRDLNDDLWKNPYNGELEEFVGAVKDLLVPIMSDVDKFGLKRRHLHKHQQVVDRFYKIVIDGRDYKCEVVQTYQKRFVRYRESLFRFLDEDGIPWNNNMAERAIRHLAVQRKISGSFFKRVAVHYLLLLGIAQTCRFQGKSFLGFLLSKEKDIDQYKEKKRRKMTVPVVGSRRCETGHPQDQTSKELPEQARPSVETALTGNECITSEVETALETPELKDEDSKLPAGSRAKDASEVQDYGKPDEDVAATNKYLPETE